MLSDSPLIATVFVEASAEEVPFGTEPPWAMTVAASGAVADAARTK